MGKLLQLVHCSLISTGTNTAHRYQFADDATAIAIERLKAQRKCSAQK